MIALVEEHRAQVGVGPLCAALGLARATFYRRRGGPPSAPAAARERRPLPQALTAADREGVLALLHEERFVDLPPAQVWAQLLDAGQAPSCSIRTMYRVLAANAEVRERRNQLRHPAYHKPELLATGPNQVWSWDITKLLGPVKWTYYYLYVPLEIFRRYVQLFVHADRGPSMTSQPVALLLTTLGVVPSHSQSHVSDDNPLTVLGWSSLRAMLAKQPGSMRSNEYTNSRCREWEQAAFYTGLRLIECGWQS